MRKIKSIIILAVLGIASGAQALIVNGKGFQQRGFHFEQSGNVVQLIPDGFLPEVALVGKKQIVSLSIGQSLRAELSTHFLSAGILRAPPTNFAGAADLFVISEENGKKAKLIFSPIGEKIQLPGDFVLRSESLGMFEVKNGTIQPFRDAGDGQFLYVFPPGQDGFRDVTGKFSLAGRVPTNMGFVRVEFRMRLSGNMTKPGWIVLNSKDNQEVMRLYVPEIAKTGQVISVVRNIPNIEADGNTLGVASVGVPLAELKFRILELKTTRNYSAR